MKTFKKNGDEKHLYFKDLKGRNGRQELAMVMEVLTRNGCQIVNRTVGPDSILLHCKINEYRFAASNVSEEGEGVVLCVDDEQTLEFLETLFNKE